MSLCHVGGTAAAKRTRAIATAAGASMLLAGCGFHFAGSEPLAEPLKSIYIDLTDPYHVTVPPLQSSLQARITRSGGVVKSNASDARSVLHLSELQDTQEVLSLGPDGKAIEYRLVSHVTYELTSDGKVLIPPQSQGLDRAYSFSATEILPKEAEEARLSRFVQEDLAEVVLLRIEAQLHKYPNGVPVNGLVPATLPASDANSGVLGNPESSATTTAPPVGPPKGSEGAILAP